MADYYVHPQALCESTDIGTGSRIWAFAHVLDGARIGKNCNICDGVFIENEAIVGDSVTLKCGVQVWNGVQLGNNVFVGPNATFTNDLFPRSRVYQKAVNRTIVEDGASIGANATILSGLTIGAGAMIGAGAVVTRTIPPNAIVVGNPGRIIGYTSSGGPAELPQSPASVVASAEEWPRQSAVNGVTLHKLPNFRDIRGALSVAEFEKDLPFIPARYFVVFDVPSVETRGEHAHRRCHQFLICVSGKVQVLADDGTNRAEFTLDSPEFGVHLPPMIWGTQYKYSKDAVLLVFASEPYDGDEYIRDYREFIRLVGTHSA